MYVCSWMSMWQYARLHIGSVLFGLERCIWKIVTSKSNGGEKRAKRRFQLNEIAIATDCLCGNGLGDDACCICVWFDLKHIPSRESTMVLATRGSNRNSTGAPFGQSPNHMKFRIWMFRLKESENIRAPNSQPEFYSIMCDAQIRNFIQFWDGPSNGNEWSNWDLCLQQTLPIRNVWCISWNGNEPSVQQGFKHNKLLCNR